MQNQIKRIIAEINPIHHDLTLQLFVGDTSIRLMRMFPCPQIGAGFAFMNRSICILGCIHELYITVILLRLFIHKFKDTISTGRCHDDRVELLADLSDRLSETLVESDKGDDRSDRHGSADSL